MIRAFNTDPKKFAFTMSPHQSRNNFASQIQVVAAAMSRVGYGALWFKNDTANNVSIIAIGPLGSVAGGAGSGGPTAIDPLFLRGEVVWTWSDGNSVTAIVTWDPKYQDATIVLSSNWTGGPNSTDTNQPLSVLVGGGAMTLSQTGFGSSFGLPPTSGTNTYDTGNLANLASHSVTNGSSSCTGSATFNSWNDGTYTHLGLTINWTLSSPYNFSQYVKLCDQLLAAATLLDIVANPTKTYSTVELQAAGSSTGFYLRYPLEFQKYPVLISGARGVGNSILALYDRNSISSGNPVGCDWYFSMFGSSTNEGCDGDPASTLCSSAALSAWISQIPFSGSGVSNSVNWQNNPLFAHGVPTTMIVSGGTGAVDLDTNSLTANPPTAPTDNVGGIFSLKSAFTTSKVTGAVAWEYDPAANTWTSATFSPGQSTIQAGGFIYDPVANLASGDVPSGYVLNPATGIYVVDTVNPFTPSNVNSVFGFVSGSF